MPEPAKGLLPLKACVAPKPPIPDEILTPDLEDGYARYLEEAFFMHLRPWWSATMLLACLIAIMACSSRAANATIIEENIFEQGTTTELGSISFPALSGTNPAGVDLSFGSFTAADITSIDWMLNPTNFDVVSLSLSALIGTSPCSTGNAPCSNSTLELTTDAALPGGMSCSDDTCSAFFGFIPVDYVAVPLFAGTPGQPNCRGQSVSGLARQYGGLSAAAAALGYSNVLDLQNAVSVYCAGDPLSGADRTVDPIR